MKFLKTKTSLKHQGKYNIHHKHVFPQAIHTIKISKICNIFIK